MGELVLNIVLVFVFVLIGGFFSATEMALVTLRAGQVAELESRGPRGAKLAALARNPNTFLSAVQIGVTVAGFASAAFGASAIAPYVAPLFTALGAPANVAGVLATVLLTLIISYLSLVLGELAPKRIALQRNEWLAYAVGPLVGGLARLLRPVIWFLSISTNLVVKLLGGDPQQERQAVGDEELRSLVAADERMPAAERKMLDDVLSLRGRQVSEVMTPRPAVSTLDADLSIGRAAERVREQPFSRYPVVGESFDSVAGFVHVRDLLEAALQDPQASITTIIRPVLFVPSSARVLPTLTKMRAAGDQIAVVVDEYGGTDGIVSFEDLVEEVVGEVFDEYDARTELAAGHGGTVSGRLNLVDFQEATGLELPRGTADTVAGLMVERLGRLARVGDVVRIGDALLRVAAVDGRRISRVSVQQAEGPQEGPETGD
jgi:putative hemolysin